MRIAFIISSLKEYGPVIVTKTLASELRKKDDVHTILYTLDKSWKLNQDPELIVRKFIFYNFPFDDFDIVHTSGIRPDLIGNLFRKKIKYHVSTIHNFVFQDLRYTYNLFVSIIFGYLWLKIRQKADKLVCVSGSLKDYYTRWILPEKMEIIYNGIRIINEVPVVNNKIVNTISDLRAKGYLILGTACILTKRKGLNHIIEIMDSLPKYALVVLGNGKEMKSLIKLVKRKKMTERCFFLGFTDGAAKYFNLFDIFLMSSFSEGFGLTLVEAVQKQVPVICSDLKVFRELFNEKEVSFFRMERNSLEKAVKDTLFSKSEKVKRAYLKYIETFTAEIMAENYYRLYKHTTT
jgi:L-malate glycosyltransferase